MTSDIKQLFLNMLARELKVNIQNKVLNLKVLNKDGNIQIIATVDTSIIKLIKAFSSQIEVHQQNLAKKLGANQVNIMFSAKSQDRTHKSHPDKIKLPNIKKVIMVASGKGGVGKSTLAAAIALNLASHKFNVAILDADIYGPSIPQIFNINKKPEMHDGTLIPHIKHNIALMSAGFLLDKGSAAIWRGPMVNKALHQMLVGTNWAAHFKSEVDFLIIDTPPGTGDIHISILEKYHIDGVIVVTTPHALANNDVVKLIDLFKITNTTILALAHNMAYLMGAQQYPFGKANHALFDIKTQVDIPLLDTIAKSTDAKTIVKALHKIQRPIEIICKKLYD